MKKILLVVTIVIFLLAILADRSNRMPLLPDISSGKFSEDDPNARMNSITRQMNEWGRQISNEDRTKITKDDTGTNRLLQGYQKDGFDNGNVGIKLSQPDIDVLTAADNELIWSSDFNSFKIVDVVTFNFATTSLTTPGTAGTYEVNTREALNPYTHGLGYAPAVIGFVQYSTSSYSMPYQQFSIVNPTGFSERRAIFRINSTTITVEWMLFTYNYAGNISTPSVKCYILQETGVPDS